MRSVLSFIMFVALSVNFLFAQTVQVNPEIFTEDQEYFVPGCGLKFAENDYRYLSPGVVSLLDSGLVDFNPDEYKIVIHPQADGTGQSSIFEPGQLPGINQKMQNLRFAFLKAYLSDSLGYDVELGEYRFAIEEGAEYRGAYISIERKSDAVVGVEAQNVTNAAGALNVSEEVCGVQFRVDFFRIPANDTTRWIDCRALLITNMGLIQSDSIAYEVSHPLAGTVDSLGRFRSAGKAGVFTVYAKYGEFSDLCNILVEAPPKAAPKEKRVVSGSFAERTDVLGYINSNSAIGAGVMMQFQSGLLIGITDAVQKWDGKSVNTLNPFLGYGINIIPNLRFVLLVGPLWESEFNDNVYDAFGVAAGPHIDYQIGRFSVFSQLLVTKLLHHQHGKDTKRVEETNYGFRHYAEILRVDKEYWRDPELLVRFGITIKL